MLDAIKSNKLLFIIGGILVAIILAGLLAFIALRSDTESNNTIPSPSKTVQQSQVTSSTPSSSTVAETTETTEEFAALVDESLLTQPIEADPALIKDELVQLNDIQTQLNEQKTLLEQQHQDSDKLIELKEKQLIALQKQLQLAESE